jgi:serpin B
MLLDGARGRTASEIALALRQTYPAPAYDKSLADLLAEVGVNSNLGGNELLSANALWVERNIPVLTDFRERLRMFYNAGVTKLDLLTSPEQARVQINRWAEENTRGKIRELFPPGAFSVDTGLVLTSAIYFHGSWASAFRPGATRGDLFKLTPADSRPTRFMHQTAVFGYADTPDAQILEMKYAGGALALDVVLPQPVSTLDDLEKSMTPQRLDSWFAALTNHTIDVSIPVFHAESDFSLREALSRLGMPTAFTSAADFSGIDDRRDLALSDVRHKAMLDVNEQGTTAAAATGSAVTLISAVVPKRFRADHPFALFIRDTRTGVILFAGRLVNPAA